MEICKETINKSRRTETEFQQQVFNFAPVVSDDEGAGISFKAAEIHALYSEGKRENSLLLVIHLY